MVADGKKMSRKELEAWAEGGKEMPMIAEYTVPWVAVESAAARELAIKWISGKDDGLKAVGWRTYAGLVTVVPDEALDLKEVEGLVAKVVAEVHSAENRVRKTMNLFVISVGCYSKALAGVAKKAAKTIGNVSVDVGDTACTVPVAGDYIAKVEGMGKAGVKRKTIRC